MKIIAVIPARYAASRFPGKLLKKLGNATVIQKTYEAVVKTSLFDQVIVAADDSRIVENIQEIHGEVVMTSADHNSGSDRIAEVIKNLDVDVVVNVQGDEPFTNKESLEALIQIFRTDVEKKIDVATLAEIIKDEAEIQNPNNVKLVMDKQNFALYFSRSAIPFVRDQNYAEFYKHIGIYAYRKEALLAFTQLESSALEQTEKLEQLRYLENGFKIKVALTPHSTIGIDTEEDLWRAEEILKQMEQ